MKKLLPEKELTANTFEVDITCDDILINEKEIELLLGYKAGQMPDHFGHLIRIALDDLRNEVQIKAGYKIVDVSLQPNNNNGLLLGNKLFNVQKIVRGLLKKSKKAALFCLTIGSGMELKSKEYLQNGEPVLGYVYDLVASAAAETCADLLHDHIDEKIKLAGLKVSNRYSPGYCNWSVDEQHLLFSLLPENFCGISLTETALMLPIKSVSGIIGIGKDVQYTEYSCNDCGIKDCTSRTIINLKKKNRLDIIFN